MDYSSLHLDMMTLQNQISTLNSNVSALCDALDTLCEIDCGSNRMLHYLIQILVHECDFSDLQQQLILQKKLSVDGGCPCE